MFFPPPLFLKLHPVLPQLLPNLPPHHTQLRLTLSAEGQSPQLRVQLEHVWERLGRGLVQDVESEI